VADLTKRRFSRSKAEYLIGAAQAGVSGALPATLGERSAVAAEQELTRIRGAGFADCAPVGDVALAAALQKLTAAAARPAADDVERLMRPFAPHRSLATFHLWASLRDAA